MPGDPRPGSGPLSTPIVIPSPSGMLRNLSPAGSGGLGPQAVQARALSVPVGTTLYAAHRGSGVAIASAPLHIAGAGRGEGTVSASPLPPFLANLLAPRALGSTIRDVLTPQSDAPPNLLWRRRSAVTGDGLSPGGPGLPSPGLGPQPLSRRGSSIVCEAAHGEALVEVAVEKSTFCQTMFNAFNVLLGVGTLSLPYAFRKGGWLAGVWIGVVAVGACYTAHLLGRIQRDALVVTGAGAGADGVYLLRRRRVPGEQPGKEEAPGADLRPEWHCAASGWELCWRGGRWRLRPAAPASLGAEAAGGGGRGGWVSVHTESGLPLRSDGTPLRLGDWHPARRPPGKRHLQQVSDDDPTRVATPSAAAATDPPWIGALPEEPSNSGQLLDALRVAPSPSVMALDQYPDIGRAAFGATGHVVLQVIFFFEIYLFLVSILILIAQNVHGLLGHRAGEALLTCAAAVAAWPQALVRDFSRLTWLSMCGMLAVVVLLFAVLYFAFATDPHSAPGSGSVLGDAHATGQQLAVLGWEPLAFSLVMSSYGGHSLFPSLYTDMEDNARYGTVVNVTFLVCTAYYVLLGVLGYLMYGNATEDIITLNMDQSSVVAKVTLGCIAVVSYTKYGINSNAICIDLETTILNAVARRRRGGAVAGTSAAAARAVVRTVVTGTALLVALYIPSFATVMSLTGAALSITISIIFPCAAYLTIFRGEVRITERLFNYVLIAVGCVFAGLGTVNSLGVQLGDVSF